MGFDVYGIKPNNEPKPDGPNWDDEDQVKAYFAWQDATPGAYFRASVWTWHPLWDFVHNNCEDIFKRFIRNDKLDVEYIDELYETCHHNDGFVIPEKCAKEIARRIHRLDKLGILKSEEKAQNIKEDKIPLEPCKVCNGTGTREGWDGWQSKKVWLKTHTSLTVKTPIPDMDDLVQAIKNPVEVGFKWANEMKGCNVCKGNGKVKPFSTSYKFRASLVRRFVDFCSNSGGFKIW